MNKVFLISLRSTEQLFLETPLYGYFLHNDHLHYFHKLLQVTFLCIHLSPGFFYRTFLFYFISTEKWNKKENILTDSTIHFSSIDLFDGKKVNFQIWEIVIWLENVFEESLMLQFSWLEEFRWAMVSGLRTLDELKDENGWKN